jgi:hypothetical protein
MTFYLGAMAFNLVAMAFNLGAMAFNLGVMALNSLFGESVNSTFLLNLFWCRDLSTTSAGLQIVLRFFLDASINSSFAPYLGGQVAILHFFLFLHIQSLNCVMPYFFIILVYSIICNGMCQADQPEILENI